jgi:hypothetical protein
MLRAQPPLRFYLGRVRVGLGLSPTLIYAESGRAAHCARPRSVEVAVADLGSGHTRDLWLDVQPPEAEEVSAEHVRGGEAKKRRHKEEKESKHAEKLHKNGKQCRLHLQVPPWGPGAAEACALSTTLEGHLFDCSWTCVCVCDEGERWETGMGLHRRSTALLNASYHQQVNASVDEVNEGCITVVRCTLVVLTSRAGALCKAR